MLTGSASRPSSACGRAALSEGFGFRSGRRSRVADGVGTRSRAWATATALRPGFRCARLGQLPVGGNRPSARGSPTGFRRFAYPIGSFRGDSVEVSSGLCYRQFFASRFLQQNAPPVTVPLRVPNGPSEADGGWQVGICLGTQAPQLTSVALCRLSRCAALLCGAYDLPIYLVPALHDQACIAGATCCVMLAHTNSA